MAGTNERFNLPDGRSICYSVYGASDGLPVFYFHGSPSSRLEPTIFGDELLSAGLHIVAPDRPGIGGSDWQASRSFSSWIEDVSHLADHLGWPRFALFGNSGGGPYVAACAALLPERVTAAIVVSGAWRMDAPEVKANLPFVNRIFWILARHFPLGLRLMLAMMKQSNSDKSQNDSSSGSLPRREIEKLEAMLPTPDVMALSAPGRMKAVSASLAEALRQGTKGAAWDARMYVHPFDFDHTCIRVPFIAFHGALDRNVPLALVRRHIAQIPGAVLKVFEEDGHLSCPCNHGAEIAGAIHGVHIEPFADEGHHSL